MPQCLTCFHRGQPLPNDIQVCTAYPDGIPAPIVNNQVDHRDPQPGDGGIVWESANGADFPDYALAANMPQPPAA